MVHLGLFVLTWHPAWASSRVSAFEDRLRPLLTVSPAHADRLRPLVTVSPAHAD